MRLGPDDKINTRMPEEGKKGERYDQKRVIRTCGL